MRYTFTATRDFGLTSSADAELVLDFMDRLDEDPGFCPMITVNSDGDPLEPPEARHLLTAAYWLGWKLYPVEVSEDPQRVEMTAGAR